eukprot:Em0023g719a
MKLVTPEISWHIKEPVYSVDFHRNGPNWRFATAGADNDVRMWNLTYNAEKVNISYMATLSRHAKAVNVVRFSPDGELLASSGDDNAVLLWKLSDSLVITTGEDEENKETWTVFKMLRGHLEDVYDLCWSRDSKYIVSGSVDNKAIIWDVQKGQHVCILGESKQYVQGVAWDPQGQWVVTHSNDRSMRIYSIQQKFKCTSTVNRLLLPGENAKQFKMFLDESASSFFRRLAFTPDGSLLIVPAGCVEIEDKLVNVTYVFARNNLSKPVLYLPALDKPTVIVRCCPIYFELRTSSQNESHPPPLFDLPYRMVYSVASVDSVMIYDTQSPVPFAYISNAHYAGITDMSWSNDGLALIISSSDGFCSIWCQCRPSHPVSIKKGTAEPKIKPRKICLAPASSPSAVEATPCVEPEARTEMEVEESVSDTEKKGKCPSESSTPTTSLGPKPRRVAFLTLCKGTDKSHLEAESCPDSSGSPASSEVKPTNDNATTSSVPGVGSADTGVSSPQAALKAPRRVGFVTLSEGADKQASVQGVPGASLSPAGLLGSKTGEAATNSLPPATLGTKSRRVDFVTLSKRNAAKLPLNGSGTCAEASKDADIDNDKTVPNLTEPMDVQIIP